MGSFLPSPGVKTVPRQLRRPSEGEKTPSMRRNPQKIRKHAPTQALARYSQLRGFRSGLQAACTWFGWWSARDVPW